MFDGGMRMYRDFRTICREKDYVDVSMEIQHIIERCNKWGVTAMPPGCGKTTILSMLYYYLDMDEDSGGLFEGSELAKNWTEYKKHLNKYIVLSLDFSDFRAKTMDEAREYIYCKI